MILNDDIEKVAGVFKNLHEQKRWQGYKQFEKNPNVGVPFRASPDLSSYYKGFDDGAASVARKQIEWEFKKVRKMVEDTIPAHHRTGTAGVVYAAMAAAMDAVLADLEVEDGE